MGLHGLAVHLCEVAFNSHASSVLPASVAAAAAEEAAELTVLESETSAADAAAARATYARTSGVRVKRARLFIRQPHIIPATIVMSQIGQLLAVPLAYFLACNTARHSNAVSPCRPVPVLDLMHQPTSMTVRVLQGLADVMSLPSADAFPLWNDRGLPAIVVWSALRMSLCAAGALWLRVHNKFSRWSYQYMTIADSRVTPRQRLITARLFGSAPSCCLEENDAAVLQSVLKAVANVTGQQFEHVICSETWVRSIGTVADSLDLNTADVEDLHAQHKKMDGSGAETVSSGSLLRQAARWSATAEATLRNHADADASAMTPADQALIATVRRKWSALHFFHWQRIREAKVGLGAVALNGLTPAAWADSRAAFASLSDIERESYARIASLPDNRGMASLADCVLQDVMGPAAVGVTGNSLLQPNLHPLHWPDTDMAPPHCQYVGVSLGKCVNASGVAAIPVTAACNQGSSVKAMAEQFVQRPGVSTPLAPDAKPLPRLRTFRFQLLRCRRVGGGGYYIYTFQALPYKPAMSNLKLTKSVTRKHLQVTAGQSLACMLESSDVSRSLACSRWQIDALLGDTQRDLERGSTSM